MKSEHFLKTGSSFYPSTHAEVLDKLPVGTYTVMRDGNGNLFLYQTQGLIVGTKLYGDVEKRAQRVMDTFNDRDVNTGVLLQGDKGAGKTLFAKVLANYALANNMPVILVNQNHKGDGFNSLLQSIKIPCMVFFDEFEKVFSDTKDQNAMLTLFDGSVSSKKLFVVTCNDWMTVSDFMKNRPGRFFYNFIYEGLEEAFIRDYCEDVLEDKSQINAMVAFAASFKSFNFDILKAIVEEMNRYKEPLLTAVKYLNASPMDNRNIYSVLKYKIEKPTFRPGLAGEISYGQRINPYTDTFNFTVFEFKEGQKVEDIEDADDSTEAFYSEGSGDGKQKSVYLKFSPSDLYKVEDGKLFFKNAESSVIIEVKPYKRHDLEQLMKF